MGNHFGRNLSVSEREIYKLGSRFQDGSVCDGISREILDDGLLRECSEQRRERAFPSLVIRDNGFPVWNVVGEGFSRIELGVEGRERIDHGGVIR